MAQGRVVTTDAEIDAALERAKEFDKEPRVTAAKYNRDLDVVALQLNTGRRLVIPREELQGLNGATEAQLAEIEIFAGLSLAWPQLDVDHYALRMNPWIVSISIAYLLGSIPFGYLLVRIFRHVDIREQGSGNIGATNVARPGASGIQKI
jgi:Glycerol-3-phosphate acyltransferase/Protein of unknown function (DUF2442)